jgi:hypothetical protein
MLISKKARTGPPIGRQISTKRCHAAVSESGEAQARTSKAAYGGRPHRRPKRRTDRHAAQMRQGQRHRHVRRDRNAILLTAGR